jgi:hypothetical protein
MTDENLSLFAPEEIEPWRAEWVDMPEFDQRDLTSWKSVVVHFATPGDMASFSEVVEQNLTGKTRSLWFPQAQIGRLANKRYIHQSAL